MEETTQMYKFGRKQNWHCHLKIQNGLVAEINPMFERVIRPGMTEEALRAYVKSQGLYLEPVTQ